MSKPLNRTVNRHTVLRYIADNPGQIHRLRSMGAVSATFIRGIELAVDHGVKSWKRTCADLYSAGLIEVTTAANPYQSDNGAVSITTDGAAELARWDGMP